MKLIRKIALTELQSLFYSPIAWLILILFTFQSSQAFLDILGNIVMYQDMSFGAGNVTQQLFASQQGVFPIVQGYLYLYIPLLTMGLMSREISSGSIKLLYSSPVKNSQIILGKYLSMMVYGLVLIAILFTYVLWAAFTVKNFDLPVALSGLLGLYLLICAYAAIGLFMSSLTSYQVVAAVGTLATLAALNMISRLGQNLDVVRDITYWLAIAGRADEAIGGLLCTEDILYFIIVSAMFLTLSVLQMKSFRQKTRWQLSFGKYFGVVVAAMLLGYITSRPTLMFFYDTTATKQRSLTKNSQDIIKRAEGGLTMTTYVNALEIPDMMSALPSRRKFDMKNFSQYIRFKPEMKVKYEYYYTNPGGWGLERRYKGMTDVQMVGKFSKAASIDSNMFMSPEKMKQKIDLAPEGFRLVRLLERDNGRKTFLRMFDDMERYPGETEISAALKRLVMDLPVIGFVSGHGEREYNNDGDRGYYRFSQDKRFRFALINQGFDCREVRLNTMVPAQVNIMIIADMRSAITPEEQANLDAYIARGGNLLILGETRRQEVMNPFVSQFGVQFMPGQLVKYLGDTVKSEDMSPFTPVGPDGAPMRVKNSFPADLIQSHLTKTASDLDYLFEGIIRKGGVVTMPGAVGMTYTTDKGYKVLPLLVSDTLDSWNELETTDFIDDTVRVNSSIGEVKKSYPTGLALSRQVGKKEQKIIIMGDADWLSNSEVSKQRARIQAANFNMLMATFYWMSDNEVPIDVRRPVPADNKIFLTVSGVDVTRWILLAVFPGLLLVAFLILWLRRRRR